MTNKIETLIEQVKDPATRAVLIEISKEFDRIRAIPPVTNDLNQVAAAVNKITEKI